MNHLTLAKKHMPKTVNSLFMKHSAFMGKLTNTSPVKDACELAETLHIRNLILYHTEDDTLKNRKELYTKEGSMYYHGTLYIPNDLDEFEL